MYGNSTYEDSQDYTCDRCGEIMNVHELGYLGNPTDENCNPHIEIECYCDTCWELKRLEKS